MKWLHCYNPKSDKNKWLSFVPLIDTTSKLNFKENKVIQKLLNKWDKEDPKIIDYLLFCW